MATINPFGCSAVGRVLMIFLLASIRCDMINRSMFRPKLSESNLQSWRRGKDMRKPPGP